MHKLFFANLLPGTLLFKRFVLESCIGASNYGGVYLCKDSSQGDRYVAIKIISTQLPEIYQQSCDLERELKFSREVNHPNVIKGEEFFKDQDFIAYTMEYIGGGCLADQIQAKKNYSLPESIKILSQLCSAVQAIHQAGIVHRDIKPDNVLVNQDNWIKVTDFGISTSIKNNSAPLRDNITGSLNYLSPEYVIAGEFDQRSDIYSLGVVAYELLTGRLPFQGKSVLDSLRQRVIYDPTPPHQVYSAVPRPLSYAVMKAIERTPSKRFQSALEFEEALSFIKLPLGLTPWIMQPSLSQG